MTQGTARAPINPDMPLCLWVTLTYSHYDDAGLYNETAFRGLDFVLDQASQYGVKVMFTLANNWKTFDSKYNVSPSSLRCRCE